MAVIVANEKNDTDGVASNFLQRVNSPIPIVLVARCRDFKFNEALWGLDKYILADYVELNWDWDMEEGHRWGSNTDKFPHIFDNDEWRKLDNFIKEKPPVLSFVRELLQQDVTQNTLPIEYPNWQPPIPLQSMEEFNNRPISAFHFWGRSHEARLKLHGDFWHHASTHGYNVCDNIFYLQKFLAEEKGKHLVSFNIPHYFRTSIENIIAINGLSKLSISLHGAGTKCFRTTGESPINSCMVMQESKIAYSFPWVHGKNCLKFPDTPNMETIEEALKREDLYEIYCEGVANSRNYAINSYIPNYIEKNINERV